MTLLETVLDLQKKEQIIPRDWICVMNCDESGTSIETFFEDIAKFPNEDDGSFVTDLRNSAPEMLAALAKIQKGDADNLKAIAAYMQKNNSDAYRMDTLNRLIVMCRMMEVETK
jgi:hypothetical protein